MTYFVYENWRAEGHKARIHLATCSFCNNGQGTHPDADNRNGRWHGPFESYEIALDLANKIGNKVSSCKHCLPH